MESSVEPAAIEPIEAVVSSTAGKEAVEVEAEVAADVPDDRVALAGLLVCATPVLAEEHLQSNEFI